MSEEPRAMRLVGSGLKVPGSRFRVRGSGFGGFTHERRATSHEPCRVWVQMFRASKPGRGLRILWLTFALKYTIFNLEGFMDQRFKSN